jgi:Cu2+-containing amine oxidase
VTSWHVHDLYVFNQGPYDTVELLPDYNRGAIKHVKFPYEFIHSIHEQETLARDDSLPLRHNADVPPPGSCEPHGPRYSIDGHHVTSVGWSFQVTSNHIRGPGLFDVKFKSERIAYEISLNDITLIYNSGTAGAGQQFSVLSGTIYGLGVYKGIIPGVDCPLYATVINVTDWGRNSPVTRGAICVFEADGQAPLWRHKISPKMATGLRNHYLVVRVPINLGNYDYTVDFKLYLDGRILTMVDAS